MNLTIFQSTCNSLRTLDCAVNLAEQFLVFDDMTVQKIDKRKISHSMVAFVDLLGFSERVKAIETLEDLADVQAKVRNVQTWFGRKPKEKFEREEANLLSKSVLAFSDCVVIAVSSHSELAKMQGGFDVFMGELTSFAYAQAMCVANGIFIRGGVDIGLWYRAGDTMISPAMVGGYEIEGAACVPMIALSDDMVSTLENHPYRKFYGGDNDPFKKVLRQFTDLPNGKGFWMIDYLPLALEAADGHIRSDERLAYEDADRDERERMRTAAYERDCREIVEAHRDAIRAAHRAAPNASVRKKYVWLANYHNEALKRFYRKPEKAWLLSLSAD